ncbi:diguanylate phosphodiesterase [Pseudoalteromonas sp. XI10]|uniref:bifunctional diguanylate cyclase/phosphodiesterase n=1 Tax=Pseudoalteromonas sp. XI10 TaxID=1766621 RepID=UPI0007338B1C|nr:EAL domain-containing protein [Pseudoalteromonas sp. XI10]KTG20291.1 diguanylate phosphodiesterase [Pseudoalteromonas sp. XI10]
MLKHFKQGISLKLQIYSLIVFICMLSFSVKVYTDIDSTTDYLESQMASHAQDTATSLGLSISSFLEPSNITIAQTMASAIFDSGYYSSIRFIDGDGSILINLNNPRYVDSVPNWFINFIKLKAPTMVSEVSSGWVIAGNLEVTSHVGQSYMTLWEHTKKTLLSAFIILLVSMIFAYLILQTVFRPLKDVEQQANLVTKKQFTLNHNLPVARELRIVTNALNKMVSNLHKTFETLTNQSENLTKQVYLDSLTELGNRKSFENHYKSVVDFLSDDEHISIMMVQLPSLDSINKSLTYLDGDNYVLSIANILKKSVKELNKSKAFRLNGGTFIFFAQHELSFFKSQYHKISKEIQQKENLKLHVNGIANISIASISKGVSVTSALSLLDTNCTIGELEISIHDKSETSLSVSQWRQLINDIIKSAEINYSIQPVKKSKTINKQCYFEVFSHFIHQNNKVNNSHLFSMADNLNLTESLDKVIIENFIPLKEQFPNDLFALNISKSSLYSKSFINWLVVLSQQTPILQQNLIFEVNEFDLLHDVDEAKLHIEVLKDLGINVCIEHFGTSLTSFKYLQGLNISYVKLDGSYMQNLTDDSQSQFFVQTVNNICHGFGIKVLACLIENSQTLELVEDLGCDGVQGNWIAKPSKVEKKKYKSSKCMFTFCTETLKFSNYNI